MKWEEVRQAYPHQWVKLKVLKSHLEDNKEYIEEMEVIKTIDSDLEAGRELGKCKESEVVYHTFHEEIYLEIRNIFGFRVAK
ncbi:MAG: hypothetical protein HPY74_05375 [Firmicutes bacterium]|nr:hypothetical protein [Bacillota bacterium]